MKKLFLLFVMMGVLNSSNAKTSRRYAARSLSKKVAIPKKASSQKFPTKKQGLQKALSPAEQYKKAVMDTKAGLLPTLKDLSGKIDAVEMGKKFSDQGEAVSDGMNAHDAQHLQNLYNSIGNMFIATPDNWLKTIGSVRAANNKTRGIKVVPSSFKEVDGLYVESSLAMDRALDHLKRWIYSKNANDYRLGLEELEDFAVKTKKADELFQKTSDPAVQSKVYTKG